METTRNTKRIGREITGQCLERCMYGYVMVDRRLKSVCNGTKQHVYMGKFHVIFT
jgi:hypothetical protein